jgi:hypothetical protein
MPMPTVTLEHLNEHEQKCRARLTQLEAQLNLEIEQEHDPNNPFTATLTLKVLCRQMMVKHHELARVHAAQIQCLRASLRSYGAD